MDVEKKINNAQQEEKKKKTFNPFICIENSKIDINHKNVKCLFWILL